ncbi:hypothetical protein TNIN_354961 [Trichonephila inaurata madagascariensis]|uniref:Uncharacterized protein n=1 Tax=Trichonephila inaurata madagascariensis TaxID=2747483 RepID=A0A8X6ME31_9ARAC|nr:hypothetical protein TNIN_354961 [Trichonephila inaurata madagascariensis]
MRSTIGARLAFFGSNRVEGAIPPSQMTRPLKGFMKFDAILEIPFSQDMWEFSWTSPPERDSDGLSGNMNHIFLSNDILERSQPCGATWEKYFPL